MEILQIYVPRTEYFPTFLKVVNFKNKFWEGKLLETKEMDGNIFTFLRPEGMIALRLANPKHALEFDRVPRRNLGGLTTTQSSAKKFCEFQFRKLGNLLVGDLVKLGWMEEVSVEGQVQKIPCQMYFLITDFYIEQSTYKADGKYFIHSSSQQPRLRVPEECFMQVKDKKAVVNFEALKFEDTLRFSNDHPRYCPYMYDEAAPRTMHLMPDEDFRSINTSLELSMRRGCVQVVTNIHIDDASMVQSKVWKSASVCDIQIAGAPPGIKGNEFNNMIIGLTDTSKISLRRLFDGVCEQFVRLGTEGFECYDSFTNKIEKVKLPVAAVFSDLPAKAEITPFTGWQANVFCSKDMYNKRSDIGVLRDSYTERRQIQEIQNEPRAERRKRLGVQFGLDKDDPNAIIDTLHKFDMTQDLPADILHHFTLGWCKKSFIYLKDEILSAESLDQICQIFDQIPWKEYSSRTNSNALRKAGSQIGRNIRALVQVFWYGLWVLIGTDLDRYRVDLEIFLRVFFYLGKLNFLFFNKHTVSWSDFIMNEADDAIRTVVAIFRRDMEVLVPGPKTHDLEHHLHTDIVRHGGPAGFDCQAGESKMKVQR